MNLGVGFAIMCYWAVIVMLFVSMPSVFSGIEGYSNTVNLNDSALDKGEELDRGGFFSTGISFSRFFSILLFGIGLPEDTPSTFKFFFFIWQTLITILTAFWIWDSLWSG